MNLKKQRVDAFFNNTVADRVPVAFWSHFVSFHDHHMGLNDPGVLPRVVAGQKAFVDRFDQDFIKIMSDGFFGHPALMGDVITGLDGIRSIRAVGPEHTFVRRQIDYVRAVCDHVDGSMYTFYNIFSPLQYIRLKFEEYDEDFKKFAGLFFADPDCMAAAAGEIASDALALIDGLFRETKVDGIYYSVQAVQDKRADRDFHKTYVEPLDLLLLERMSRYTDKIILHICGYGNYKNPLQWYRDYPVQAFNWAVYSENVDLAEGKRIFGGKPVFGGFDNKPGTLLYAGSRADIAARVRDILATAGRAGVGIGADCTVSEDLTPDRVQWVAEAARQ